MPGENVERLETSFDVSLLRFVEGLTPAQIIQHRDAFETALRALDSYVTSPRGQNMHPDVSRFWNFQRATFHRHVLQLTQLLQSRSFADPALAPVRELLASKPRAEWLRVQDDLRLDVRRRSATPAIESERLAHRRKELDFVNFTIANPD
jgi:hypothetical protein